MRELSLFTGIGGGVLGTTLLGWRPIGYVEINDYCQRVLAQRIRDGVLPAAPIFTDINLFLQSGAARQYKGIADVVTAGFPCQPFSLAGSRSGEADARNLWPATLETICLVRPRYVFLENVPGLLSSGYYGLILGDLAESGYDVRWRILSAAEVGAPHLRKRLWIAAHTGGYGFKEQQQPQYLPPQSAAARSNSSGVREGTVRDTNSERYERSSDTTKQNWPPELNPTTWWEAEPDVGRLVDGFPGRVDRLKALGNAQVPAVVAAAWHLLMREEGVQP